MKNALLWRITASSSEPALVSYLFGTMHVRDNRAFGQVEMAERCLAECAVFATEFNFSDLDQTALAAALQLPEGLLLEDLLGKNAWKRLAHFAAKHPALHPDALRFEHPMRVSAILSAGFMAEETPCSLDETLWNSAKALGLETTGVETFAEQIQILRSITLEEHVENLRAFLKNQKAHKRRSQKMLEWYQNGDLQNLYRSAKRETRGLRARLLYRRNEIMTARFAAIAREKTLFCAVGAGHLAGAKGMLRGLKKMGFEAQPLTNNDLSR